LHLGFPFLLFDSSESFNSEYFRFDAREIISTQSKVSSFDLFRSPASKWVDFRKKNQSRACRAMLSGESWTPASSAAEMRSQLNRERFMRNNLRREEKDRQTGPALAEKSQRLDIRKFIRSPLGMALIAFFIVFLLLVAINPPLTQSKSSISYMEAKPNFKSIAIYSGIVAAIVFASPYIARHFNTEPDPNVATARKKERPKGYRPAHSYTGGPAYTTVQGHNPGFGPGPAPGPTLGPGPGFGPAPGPGFGHGAAPPTYQMPMQMPNPVYQPNPYQMPGQAPMHPMQAKSVGGFGPANFMPQPTRQPAGSVAPVAALRR
jgi:hypothetical protein